MIFKKQHKARKNKQQKNILNSNGETRGTTCYWREKGSLTPLLGLGVASPWSMSPYVSMDGGVVSPWSRSPYVSMDGGRRPHRWNWPQDRGEGTSPGMPLSGRKCLAPRVLCWPLHPCQQWEGSQQHAPLPAATEGTGTTVGM